MQRIIYTTVGTMVLVQEKFKELMEDLIQNQHYTEEEGKRIVDDFFYTIRANYDAVNGNIQSKVEDLLKDMKLEGILTWKQDLQTLINDWKSATSLPTKYKY